MPQDTMGQQSKITLDQVLTKVVQEIRNKQETPFHFFKKFDAFQSRKF